MKYITEYIEISPLQTRVELSHVPFYVHQSASYALLEDSFKLFKKDFSSHIQFWGKIVFLEDAYYLTFNQDDLIKDYTNVVVTYGVDDRFSSNIDTSNLLPSSQTTFNDIEVDDIELRGYITSHIDFLASQYKDSERLKAVIVSFLTSYEELFLLGDSIPYMLDLDRANGFYLDLIGKIIGVGRMYCGNFLNTLNYQVSSYKELTNKIESISLSDSCMRKLIKVKIQKNMKDIVNYKELSKIISEFLGQETFIETCGEFSIKVAIRGGIDDNLRKCLILLRAFLPLPPTIQLLYLEVMEFPIDEIAYISSYGIQTSTFSVQKAPIIPIVLEDNEYVVQHYYQLVTMEVEE